MGFYILKDSDVQSDIAALDRAWSNHHSFVLIADKANVHSAWIEGALQKLPQQMSEQHFGLLTSGSTGYPKLIIGCRRRAEALATLLHDLQLSAKISQTIVSLPLTYCYAFVNQWLWARVNRRQLTLTKGFSEPDQFRNTLQIAENAMLCLVGAQVPLLRQLMDDACFPGILRLHFAGGRFPQEDLDFLGRLFPNALIFNNYGCAEAMPRLTLRRAESANAANNIGKPLPGIELSTDNNGNLLFRSCFSAVAFIDNDKVHIVEPAHWIETGDLGAVTSDGSWEIHGRVHEVFKRFGEKIALSQLLNTVYSAWSGEAAFYRERDSTGEDGCVLVLAPLPDQPQVLNILKSFRVNHTRPHWPLRIEGVNILPKLTNRKVDWRQLAVLDNKIIYWQQRL